ncbi:unnamed protein product [Adineta steineri]|uniref:Uncharacterized protein n=1 Tax=Adineta steineri TaxID=433720 RepID=A0A815WN01_9BILA|nr:unnamed protein product [Adineta steineri]CAF1551206.1 unnamed protein product [Adineta steineri]
MPINSLYSVTTNGPVSDPASHSDFLHALTLIVTAFIEDALQRELVIELMDQYSLLFDISEAIVAQTSMNHDIHTHDHSPITNLNRSQMYETITLYIKSYRDYAQHNIRPLKPDEHLEPIAPPTEVFAMVGLDC